MDFLRFAAVALVLMRHLQLAKDTPTLVRKLFSPWMMAGWIGVDLFFVLSGFLISGLLFREFLQHGRIDFKTFFIRRGLKIYPAFYLLILAQIGVGIALGRHVLWARVLSEIVFIQNYAAGLWTHTWSLAVEEHFYLLLPLLLILMARRSPGSANPFKPLPGLFLALAGCVLAIRFLTAWRVSFIFTETGAFYHRQLFPTHLRIDSLFFGVVLSYLHHFHPVPLRAWVTRRRLPLAGVASLAIAPCFFLPLETTPFNYIGGFTTVYIGMGLLLLLCMTAGLPGPSRLQLLYRFGALLGSYSYSIYLWHLATASVVSRVFDGVFHLPWWMLSGAYLVGSLVVGIILGKLVELPVLKLRDRLFPSRSKPLNDLAKVACDKAQA
jgi:peptidoglycan/LPS O-acetylase OafA/YrhL